MDLPTRQDLYEIARAELLAGNTLLSPDEVDTEGSDAHAILQSIATLGSVLLRQMILATRPLRGTTAQGEELDEWAWDRFRMRRLPGTPSTTPLVFSRTDTAVDQEVPAGTSVSGGGVTFLTIETGVLPAGDSEVTVDAVCTVAGVSGNVPAGTLQTIDDDIPGAELSVGQPEPAQGGADDEKTEAFRERVGQFWLSAQRGTLKALEYGARDDPSVAFAVAVELLHGDGTPAGPSEVLVSGADQQQLNPALVERVRERMEEWRCLGLPLQVVSAEPVEVPITWRVAYRAGLPGGTTAARNRLRDATVAAVNSLRASETLEVAILYAAAKSVPGVIVYGPDRADGKAPSLVEPAGDIVPETHQVLRTTRAKVTILHHGG